MLVDFWGGVVNVGFTGHTESGDSSGVFPSLPTSTVEVKSGDGTLWEVCHPDWGPKAGPPLMGKRGVMMLVTSNKRIHFNFSIIFNAQGKTV